MTASLPVSGSSLRLLGDVLSSAWQQRPVQNDLVDDFVRTYGSRSTTRLIPGIGPALHIFSDREAVSKVLAARTSLGPVNDTLNALLEHRYSINCVDTHRGDSRSVLHVALHRGVKDSFARFAAEVVDPGGLMEMYQHLLQNSDKTAQQAIDDFSAAVWAHYCYGASPDSAAGQPMCALFDTVRRDLVAYLGAVFHQNKMNTLPWGIGLALSQGARAAHAETLQRMREGMTKLYDFALSQPNSAAARFRTAIWSGCFDEGRDLPSEYVEWRAGHPREAPEEALRHAWVDHVTRENMELSILALDFITLALTEKVIVAPGEEIDVALRTGFLFPVRFRRAEEDIPAYGVRRGDWMMLDLRRAGLYFSAGLRGCPGQTLVKPLFAKFAAICEELGLRAIPGVKVERGPNVNVPVIISPHTLTWTGASHRRGRAILDV